MSQDKMLRAARWYFEKVGWKIIPSHEKRALVSGWGQGGTLVIDKVVVRKWWEGDFRHSNISLICGRESNVIVIDTDNEEAEGTILELLPTDLDIPTTQTPRGGKHRFFRYEKGFISRTYEDGLDVKTNGGLIVLPPSENNKGNYTWEKHVKQFSPPPMPDRLSEYLKQLEIVESRLPLSTSVPLGFKEGTRDQDLFHVAWCLSKGQMTDKNINHVLEILGQSCNPPFPKKELIQKIRSAFHRLDQLERNIAEEVRSYALSTTGFFSSPEVYACLLLSTRRERKLVSKTLNNMVDDGWLEKHTRKNGLFRRIEAQCEAIDFLSADETEIPFKWPLGEEKLFKLMPKNVVIIAGTPDAGKTAYLLNVVALNMSEHEIHYFSSEMGGGEFKGRLLKYEGIALADWDFHPWDRAEGFQDVIKPDAINVIDFLEIHADFFAIGGLIKQIYDKLNEGVAIIAIQKNPKVPTPLGGYRAMEKARLIVNIESAYPGNVAEITKAKNWRTEKNPKGKRKTFRLYDGVNISETSGWEF